MARFWSLILSKNHKKSKDPKNIKTKTIRTRAETEIKTRILKGKGDKKRW
jgi:hypothetical protein